MEGDVIQLNDDHRRTAKAIVDPLLSHIRTCDRMYTIAVAGESGAGKSVTARAIAECLEKEKMKVKVFQQDDYFILPPITNDKKRRQDIHWVGMGEVKLDLLEKHLAAIQQGEKIIVKPLVIYQKDRITTEAYDMSGVDVCIVEGIYVSVLQNLGTRIFIDRTYKDTLEDRHSRSRDYMDGFIEKVLDVEHEIIRKHREKADIIVDKSFNVHFVNS